MRRKLRSASKRKLEAEREREYENSKRLGLCVNNDDDYSEGEEFVVKRYNNIDDDMNTQTIRFMLRSNTKKQQT